MKKIILILTFLPGCYWAQVHKRSVLNTYVCEWILNDKDVGPMQCRPLEDWQQENSVCVDPGPRPKGPQNHEL